MEAATATRIGTRPLPIRSIRRFLPVVGMLLISAVGLQLAFARTRFFTTSIVLRVSPTRINQEKIEPSDRLDHADVVGATATNKNSSFDVESKSSDNPPKSNINPMPAEDSILLNECYVRANTAHILQRSEERRRAGIPLFTSIVKAPESSFVEGGADRSRTSAAPQTYWTAHFSLADITWKKGGRARVRIPYWYEADWQCDGQAAEVVDRGCPGGMGITLVCPQHIDAEITNITVYNYTYYVHDHVKCENQHPLRAPSKDAKLAVAVVMYRMNLKRLLEWVEYHRIVVGVDHFFIYTMDKTLDSKWPDLPYLTYIPWDLNPWMIRLIDIFLHQTAAQVDAILRGRALGLEWVSFNDMDEFLVPRLPQNVSDDQVEKGMKVKSYLERYPDVGAIQIETATFGTGPGEVKPNYSLALNYTWRSQATFGKSRCKCIVRPTRVNYYNIHWVTSGGPIHQADPRTEIWLHHYKQPDKGVFTNGLEHKSIVRDVFLRDRYHDMIRSRVNELVLAREMSSETKR